MFCRLCGAENPDDSRFCIKCGQELVTVGQATTADTAVKEIEVTSNAQTPANLVNSTKLMFEDIFRYGKCMSRADYWYGVLGLILLMFLVCVSCVGLQVLVGHLASLEHFGLVRVIYDLKLYLLFTAIITLFLITLSATVRRLHDIGMDGAWVLLQFIPVGNVILLVFLCQRAEDENNRYRIETQSRFGQKIYGITGLIPVMILCIGLVFTFLMMPLDNFIAMQNIDTTETYYDLDDY